MLSLVIIALLNFRESQQISMSTKYRCFLLKNKLRTLAFSLTITLDICVNMRAAQCKTSISTFLLKSWTFVDWIEACQTFTVCDSFLYIALHYLLFEKLNSSFPILRFALFMFVFAIHEYWQCIPFTDASSHNKELTHHSSLLWWQMEPKSLQTLQWPTLLN